MDLNATQASIRAGYSAKSAARTGVDNIRKPNIAAAIAIAQDERAKRTGISADRALSDVRAIATADARELTQVKVDSRGRHRLMLEERKTLGFTGD